MNKFVKNVALYVLLIIIIPKTGRICNSTSSKTALILIILIRLRLRPTSALAAVPRCC